MGGSEFLSPLELGVNSRFCSVLSDGGSEFFSPLESGVNSRFCSGLSDGGIRIFEPLSAVRIRSCICEKKDEQ